MQKISNTKAINADTIPFDLLSSSNTFKYELELYLKDSNAYGNIYFAKHFEWQGDSYPIALKFKQYENHKT